MKLSKNFTLSEFTKSATAKLNNIDNTISVVALSRVQYLVRNLLQPLRDKYGKPLTVSSGYRCEKLNKAVGGVPTSQHTKGEAADVKCDNPIALLDVLLHSGLEFDQAILYPTFLHLSIKEGGNRKMVIRK
ncbi:MAG: D-Ala-D-Ala carboxypeptidase family metallohydrolase [Rikenellaceae bacterium]